MKTIFAQLYTRIMDFFQGEKGEQTSQCAANRLQVILMHDRTKLDAVTMGKMREELIGVFSKYVIIDKEELEIGLKSEGDSVALMLNIPIIRAKTEEELAEALKEDEEDEHSDETVEETEEDDGEENSEEVVSEEQSEENEEIVESADDEQDETVEETSEIQEEEPKTEEKNNKKTK